MNLPITISIFILLVMAGIFGFNLAKKAFFNIKWKEKNKELKQVRKSAEAIRSGEMLDSSAFDNAITKKDSFVDKNTIQGEADVNFAYQNINYRNKLLKEVYAGYKALDIYAGQKTISAMKTKNTSEVYPTRPETDVDKSKVKSKHAKTYMLERNISYSYTPEMKLSEKIMWILTLVLTAVTIGWTIGLSPEEPTTLLLVTTVITLLTFVGALVMWGLRFLSFGVQMSDKAKKKLSQALFDDVKTIQWLDDILIGFITRNPKVVPILKEAFEEEYNNK